MMYRVKMQRKNINDFDIITKIQENIKKQPDKKAIIFPTETIMFKELDEQSGFLAYFFKQKNIEKGDRVVVLLPVSPMLFYVIFALIKIEATVVFIDHNMSFKNINNSIKISKSKAFVGNSKTGLLRFFSKDMQEIPIKIIVREKSINESKINYKTPIQISEKRYTPGYLMFVRFTTGSTGFPKGVERTYQYMCDLFRATHDFSKIKENDVDLTVFPMNILYNLMIGATTVYPLSVSSNKYKINAKQVVKQMLENNVTTASGPPDFWRKIVAYCKRERIVLDKIRFIFTGGDPVPLPLVYDLKQVFPKSETNIVYGSTEVFPISWIDIDAIIGSKNRISRENRAMCVGKPHPKLKIRIIEPMDKPIVLDEAGLDKITLKDGEIGEIIISGDHVVKNYFGDEDKTVFIRNKIIDKDGRVWHRTGDLGFLDKNEIWFAGRIKH